MNSGDLKQRLIDKANGYLKQDLDRGRATFLGDEKCKKCSHAIVKWFDILSLLLEQGIHCQYCKIKTRIIPPYSGDRTQMTLDRINNRRPHTADNLIVACLKCNVGRGAKWTVADFKKIKSSDL